MRAINRSQGAVTLGLAGAALLLAAGSARNAPEPSTAGEVAVTVHADQPQGRFSAQNYTNITYPSAYGPTIAAQSDVVFNWVRATNALSRVRCYNWLGDGVPKAHPDWFTGCRVARTGQDGALVYQWEPLERVLDTLVASGVAPVIVCGGLPDPLLEGPPRRNDTGQAANRPRDYAQYQELIAQMLRRLVKTYGAKEVRTWQFEVWNQPDHEGSWAGGRPAPFTGEPSEAAVAPFLRLYDHFVAAADSVDPRLRVGGPGLAGDVGFLNRFLTHCARGTNAVTGKPGTRLDFLSVDRFGEPLEVARWCQELRKRVAAEYPELKNPQLMLAETGVRPADVDRADEVSEAARMAALVEASSGAERGADQVFRSGDLIDNHFDGDRPLVTQLGNVAVPLPAFRLNMLLAKLGGERVSAEATDAVGALATRTSATAKNATQTLLFRRDLAAPNAAPVTVKLKVSGLPRNLLRLPLRVYTITPETRGMREAWVAAGKPTPAPAELATKFVGEGTFQPVVDEPGTLITSGEATVPVVLPPGSVALVTLASEPTYAIALSDRGERLRRAEQEYSLAADLLRRRQPDAVIETLRKIQDKYADTYWREVALQTLVGVYEVDKRSPVQAEATRRELLELSLDGIQRLNILSRLRVDALRRGESAEVAKIATRIQTLEARLAALRNWPLTHYSGE